MAKRRWIRHCLLAACAVILGVHGLVATAADDPVLTSAYGTGVHAYHAGDYQRSFEDLTAVIDGGARDPRAFYFRGLAALKLGRFDEAEADFAAGAAREAAALGSWNIPRSLERVQGEDRLRLERHRATARVALMQKRREAIIRRYTEVDAAQEGVLRRRRPEARPGRESPAEAGEQPRAEANEELPEPEPTAEEAPVEEAPAEDAPMAEETGSPFADDPVANEAPAADEAMEEEPAEQDPAEEQPAEEEPADEPPAETEPADEEMAEEADADAAEGGEEKEQIPE